MKELIALGKADAAAGEDTVSIMESIRENEGVAAANAYAKGAGLPAYEG